jgi:nitrite reductase/ring-hydroxylating ferredoxin subunit
MNSGEDWSPIDGVDPEREGFPARAELDGDKIVVFRVGDGFRAVQRYCPHQNTDFSRGLIVGDGAMLRCGLHAYTFKLADGNGVNCPGYRIAVYEVIRDGARLVGRRVDAGG